MKITVLAVLLTGVLLLAGCASTGTNNRSYKIESEGTENTLVLIFTLEGLDSDTLTQLTNRKDSIKTDSDNPVVTTTDSKNPVTNNTSNTGVVAPVPGPTGNNGTPTIGYITETVDLRQIDDRYFGWCNLPGAAYGKDIVLDDGNTITRVADPSKNYNKGTGNGNPIWSAGDDNNPGVNSGGKAGYHSGTGYSPTTLTITYKK